jgi:hypothetical protein
VRAAKVDERRGRVPPEARRGLFLIARHWKKKGFQNLLRLIILFPLIYVLLDIIIITAAGVKWSDFFLIFAIANGAKILGSYLGYKLTK